MRSGVESPSRRRLRGFWTVAVTFGLFLAAASAPSPLYAIYAQRWSFSTGVLTAVFAVYSVALLATLLTAGSLSDAIGRRPVILASIGIQSVAMFAFIVADGVGWLVGARVLQGLATGLVTGASAAALIDLQPVSPPGFGALVNSVTPTVGLAVGALGAGALVQFGPEPLRAIYVLLLVCFLLCGAAMMRVPETVMTRSRPHLRPRVAVPRSIRPAFIAGLPALIAPWALGGLWLSLGPSLLMDMTGSSDRFAGGLVIFVLCIFGAIASILARKQPPRTAMVAGCAALVVGVALTGVAIIASSPWLLFACTAVAGGGFGVSFLGAFKTLASLADPASRGAVISAIYVVAYLAFSIPAVIAGVLAAQLGLRVTALGYVVCVTVIAAAAIPLARRAGTVRLET